MRIIGPLFVLIAMLGPWVVAVSADTWTPPPPPPGYVLNTLPPPIQLPPGVDPAVLTAQSTIPCQFSPPGPDGNPRPGWCPGN